MKYDKIPIDVSTQIKVIHHYFNDKGKNPLKHLPNVIKVKVYKHATRSFVLKAIGKKKKQNWRITKCQRYQIFSIFWQC